MIQNFVTSGRLLEIGPGKGIFAHVAKQAGFDVDTGPMGSIDHLISGFSSILQTKIKRVQFEVFGHQVDIGFQHVSGEGG